MVELGAGYGYWIVQGGCLARQRGLPVRLVGVEAEPGHFRMMERHVHNNGFSTDEARLIEAAVTPSDGRAYFETGSPLEWWGQALSKGPDSAVSLPGAQIRTVQSLSLATILSDMEMADVVHMDIQGAEADVLRAFAARSKVGMFIIGTHSKPIESELRALFSGWQRLFDFSIGETWATEFGEVAFGDGVQCWSNPHRFPSSSYHRLTNKFTAIGASLMRLRSGRRSRRDVPPPENPGADR
jgi:FkbM family methyltransferase